MDTAQTSPPHDPTRLSDAFRTIAAIAENRLSDEDGLRLIEALEAVTDEYTRRHFDDIQLLFAEVNAMLQRHFSCNLGKSVSA